MNPFIRIRVFLFILISMPMYTFAGGSKKKPMPVADTSQCLEISGRITGSDGAYTVKLYIDNSPADSLKIPAGKVFSFILEKNSHYTIKIEKKGYITRSVSIDTGLPKGVETDPLFRFHFDTTLQHESSVGNKSSDMFDFPIAIISYDAKKGWFDYSRKYTSIIKKDIGGTLKGKKINSLITPENAKQPNSNEITGNAG